jgi:outer membrane receptor for ferrienterochelin and colicin
MKKSIKTITLALIGFIIGIGAMAQSGKIEGKIIDALSNEPLPFVNIIVQGTNIGTTSDIDGNFTFTGLQPGFVTLQASFVGYEMGFSREIQVTNAKTEYVEIKLSAKDTEIEEVVIKASPFRKTEESPVSLNRIGIQEIETSPGSNRDLVKIIRSFPGVGSGASFRSDIIIRGGGPSESRFYLDGVEIPNINHFATQGSSGGPVGIINADFISGVNFYSGAFPANRGNALSGVFEFTQKDGNKEKTRYRGTLGASELSLTLDGPIGEKTSYIVSARQSYLRFLFNLIGLPFLPTFNDYQLKVRSRLDDKNELTIVSIGSLDQFALNTGIKDPTPEQEFILANVVVNEQWSYAIGGVYKHFRENSYQTFVLSRNMLNNVSFKYPDNDESRPKVLDYQSQEIENKFRFENNTRLGPFKIVFGLNGEFAKYNNNTQQQIFANGILNEIDYQTDFNMWKWGGFAQASKTFFNSRLVLSAGLRTDANNYSDNMQNMLNQLSPRASLSYSITDKLSLNLNSGRYFQLPSYTTLGFKNLEGQLINRENNLKYIRADHYIGGFEYQSNPNITTSIEGFYKDYANYPFSLRDSLPLATRGADFGVVGDEEVTSTGEGRAYGFEVLNRTKLDNGFNLIFSYTFVNSQFKDVDGNYTPTSWDNKHIINITASRQFKNNWTAGFKWRFLGGSPYTPYDLEFSSLVASWEVTGGPIFDFSRLNSERFKPFHQLDVRVDKKYFFDKWSLMLYVDIQNLYNYQGEQLPYVLRERDAMGNYLLTDNNSRYVLNSIESTAGTILPTIGIMVEF